MRKFLMAAAAVSLALGASAANATVFTLDSYTVTTQAGDSDDSAVHIQDLLKVSPPLNINLGSPASKTYNLFEIYPIESWSDDNKDKDKDGGSQDISVAFDFSAPSPNSGATVNGDLILHGRVENGSVSWSGPADFTWTAPGFTIPGLMTITLSQGTSDTGFAGREDGQGDGSDGGSDDGQHDHKDGVIVKATFDWANDPSGAVPEPSSWALMISGFGLAGATLRRRRGAAVVA